MRIAPSVLQTPTLGPEGTTGAYTHAGAKAIRVKVHRHQRGVKGLEALRRNFNIWAGNVSRTTSTS